MRMFEAGHNSVPTAQIVFRLAARIGRICIVTVTLSKHPFGAVDVLETKIVLEGIKNVFLSFLRHLRCCLCQAMQTL